MVGTEGLLADGDGAPVEGLGLGVAAGVLVELGEVVERSGEVGVIGAEGLLADGDGALVEWLGLAPGGAAL